MEQILLSSSLGAERKSTLREKEILRTRTERLSRYGISRNRSGLRTKGLQKMDEGGRLGGAIVMINDLPLFIEGTLSLSERGVEEKSQRSKKK